MNLTNCIQPDLISCRHKFFKRKTSKTEKLELMKILFLDCDGVINSSNFLYARGGLESQRLIENGREFKDNDANLAWYKAMIDPLAIARLQRVIESTSAKIVISSSWRKIYDLEKLIELFNSYGNLEVIDKTSTGIDELGTNSTEAYSLRGKEISYWLMENEKSLGPFKSYAVVDDSSDAAYGHDGKFVKTTWQDGMLDKHADRLIEILNKND